MKQAIARLLGAGLLAMFSLALTYAQAPAENASFDLFLSQKREVAKYYADLEKGGLTPAASYLPSSVRLWIQSDDGGRQDCSATVVSTREILTAAHCVCGEKRGGPWFARDKAGCDALLPRLTGEVFLPTEGVVAVTGYDVHPRYISPAAKQIQGDPSADLAILTLARPVSVTPAGIGSPIPGRRYLMGSFGQLLLKRDSWPLKARHVYQAGVSQVNRLEGARIGPNACDDGGSRDTFCAQYSTLRSDEDDKKSGGACAGDSGGGLYDTVNGRRVLVGVVSYIWPPAECDGRDNRHSYAVNLALYRDWIVERTSGKAVAAPPRHCADYVWGDPPERFVFPEGFSFISATVFGDLDDGPERPRLAIEGIDARRCVFSPNAGVGACALEKQERPIVAFSPRAFAQITVCWTSQREPNP